MITIFHDNLYISQQYKYCMVVMYFLVVYIVFFIQK